MSVIVRMEMPTGCANCPMADDDSRFCKAAKEYIPMLCRPSWCPIVGELPEHGDLKDMGEALWFIVTALMIIAAELFFVTLALLTERR